MHSQFSIFISDPAGGWHSAETSLCWFPGVYQRPQNSIPHYKNKILCFKRPFDGTKPYIPICLGLSSCMLAKHLLYILHMPSQQPTAPSLGYGPFGSLYVREMILCVCEKRRLPKRSGAFQAQDSSFLGKRGSIYLWAVTHTCDNHLRVTATSAGK